jgi:hypothetical protein
VRKNAGYFLIRLSSAWMCRSECSPNHTNERQFISKKGI